MSKGSLRRTQVERSAATREALLNAAISSLYKGGFGSTTIGAVADLAGVSRGAILHHFPTKNDMMTYVMDNIYDYQIREIRRLLAEQPGQREKLLALPDIIWKVLSEDSGIAVLEILVGSRSDEDLASRIRPIQAIIAERSRETLIDALGGELTPALTRLLPWALRGIALYQVVASDLYRVEEAIDLLRDFIALGLENDRIAIIGPMSETPVGKAAGTSGRT